MVNIAVCDDDRTFTENYCSMVSQIFDELSLGYRITPYFSSADFWRDLDMRDITYDVVFLDILMPEPNGFKIAELIRSKKQMTFLIFITAKDDLVYSSFDYLPFGFIRKGSGDSLHSESKKLIVKLSKWLLKYRLIEIKACGTGMIKLPIAELLYVQSNNHYLYYHTDNDQYGTLYERAAMRDRESLLSSYGFIRTHSRYLVNADHIMSFPSNTNYLILDNNEKIPVSRGYGSNAIDEYYKLTRRY